MRYRVDLTGKVFGTLTVIRRCAVLMQGHLYWVCQCKCGQLRHIEHTNLNKGRVKSCGRSCPERTPTIRKSYPRNRKRLTPEQVAAIREEYVAGGTTQRKLAEKYGVAKLTIHNLLNGHTHRLPDADE